MTEELKWGPSSRLIFVLIGYVPAKWFLGSMSLGNRRMRDHGKYVVLVMEQILRAPPPFVLPPFEMILPITFSIARGVPRAVHARFQQYDVSCVIVSLIFRGQTHQHWLLSLARQTARETSMCIMLNVRQKFASLESIDCNLSND